MLENGLFHVDHLHQMSFMLLTTDVTLEHTHMEYLMGSNKRPLLKDGISIPTNEVKKIVPRYPNVFKCIGKKGTLFIFDTTGIHRAEYVESGIRRILHLNFTTGQNLDKDLGTQTIKERGESLKIPDFIKRTLRYETNLTRININ